MHAGNMAAQLGLQRKVTNVTVVKPDALFTKDLDEKGEKDRWFDPK